MEMYILTTILLNFGNGKIKGFLLCFYRQLDFFLMINYFLHMWLALGATNFKPNEKSTKWTKK
jgi:hypothetical protein